MSARPRFTQKERLDARRTAKADGWGKMYGGVKTRAEAGLPPIPKNIGGDNLWQMLGDEYLRQRRRARCARYSNRIRRWGQRDARRRGITLQGR